LNRRILRILIFTAILSLQFNNPFNRNFFIYSQRNLTDSEDRFYLRAVTTIEFKRNTSKLSKESKSSLNELFNIAREYRNIFIEIQPYVYGGMGDELIRERGKLIQKFLILIYKIPQYKVMVYDPSSNLSKLRISQLSKNVGVIDVKLYALQSSRIHRRMSQSAPNYGIQRSAHSALLHSHPLMLFVIPAF
jgi:hypothetical protein